MQDINELVNMAVTEAIQQKLHKCVEDRLDANFFHCTCITECHCQGDSRLL